MYLDNYMHEIYKSEKFWIDYNPGPPEHGRIYSYSRDHPH